MINDVYENYVHPDTYEMIQIPRLGKCVELEDFDNVEALEDHFVPVFIDMDPDPKKIRIDWIKSQGFNVTDLPWLDDYLNQSLEVD